MKYTVNENCIGCGLCADTCPAVFSMKDDGYAKAAEGPVDPADAETAAAACENCPVDAIEEAD